MVKRKGTDFLNTSVSSSVSVGGSVYDDAYGASWEQTRARMKAMRAQNVDSLLASLRRGLDLQESLSSCQESLVSDAQHIKNQLLNRIELAREACKEESDDLYKMQLTLQQLHMEREQLLEALDDLEASSATLHSQIHTHQQESNQTIETIDAVEAERMRAVPRLKQQISLYATTTGIKWDFDQEQMLVGHLTVQKTGGIRKFTIDPTEYSSFEIANHLWSLLEHGTYAKQDGGTTEVATE